MVLLVRADPRLDGGERQRDIVGRVIERARRIVDDHPTWEFSSGTNYTHIATIGPSTAQLSHGEHLPTYTIPYPNVPGTAARVFAKEFRHWLDATAAEQVDRMTTRSQQLVRAIERLVHDLNLALTENENLHVRLHSANLEIEFLRRQVDQLSESIRTGRPSIARAMLAGVSAILLGVIGGVAEGSAGQLIDGTSTGDDDIATFVERCESLIDDLTAVEIDYGDRWPTAGQDHNPDQPSP